MQLRTNGKLVAGVVLATLYMYGSPLWAMQQRAADSPSPVLVEYNVMVPMRDGVRLSTDVYRPAKAGRFPVLLIRDPYSNGSSASDVEEGRRWAARGYVYLHQDVRGRYDSEGHFYPYLAEPNDGYDTQQWTGQQPWSNGKVGTLGGSYLATTQWLSAHFRSPALTAMVPAVSPFNYYQDVAYVGGALSLGSRIGWATGMGGRTGQGMPHDWDRIVRHLPLLTMDHAAGMDVPWWRDFVGHPTYDTYWQVLDSESRLKEMDVPSYNIGGWYDVFLKGTLTSYTGMVEQARSERARRGQKLMIGPWPHSRNPNFEELDFGPEARVDFDSLHVRWFAHWLKGEDTGFLDEPPVRIFVMGENRWRSEREWPLARTQYTKYYFHSQGRANSLSGNGTLDRNAPTGSEPRDHYVYDPNNPVPTRGGNLMFQPTPPGPFDQSAVERRDDVLVFSSAPVAADLEVTGPITVTLYAASSATDTDFTAKLVDVHPDGKAINLVDGVIRARYRESFTDPVLIEPGRMYEYTIDLWATSNLFKQGHRIRVDISSSNFPRFDRNLNTGDTAYTDTELRPATQTIYHDARYPSHITLPVIPR